MSLLIPILVASVHGALLGALARGWKGRSFWAWFAAGFFFSILGLLVLCFVGNLKKQVPTPIKWNHDYEPTPFVSKYPGNAGS